MAFRTDGLGQDMSGRMDLAWRGRMTHGRLTSCPALCPEKVLLCVLETAWPCPCVLSIPCILPRMSGDDNGDDDDDMVTTTMDDNNGRHNDDNNDNGVIPLRYLSGLHSAW